MTEAPLRGPKQATTKKSTIATPATAARIQVPDAHPLVFGHANYSPASPAAAPNPADLEPSQLPNTSGVATITGIRPGRTCPRSLAGLVAGPGFTLRAAGLTRVGRPMFIRQGEERHYVGHRPLIKVERDSLRKVAQGFVDSRRVAMVDFVH